MTLGINQSQNNVCPVSKWHCMVVVPGLKFCLTDTKINFCR